MKNSKSIEVKLFLLISISLLFLASRLIKPDANEPGNTNTSATPVPDSQFIIGAFHNGLDIEYQYQSELNLNTWHHYTGPYWGWHGDTNDKINKDTSDYKGFVTGIIDKNNNDKGMRTFMDRPILEYLVSGQRIDYECEEIAPNYQAHPYWFYAYNHSLNNTPDIYDTNDYSQYGNGERVKYCKKTEQSPYNGYVLIDSGLRSNREMSFNNTNQWMKDTEYKWYVLPRIRIDSVYAADPAHYNDEVCKIIVTGWEEDSIQAEYELKVINFKGLPTSIYHGNYTDSFYIVNKFEYFDIPKNKLINFTDTNKNVFVFDWELDCFCDIKIYWSGKCDMWIDRVRLENLPAHQYLTLKENRWINKLNSEIYWAGSNYNSGNPIPNYFYFEECQMSHFPAIAEINKQIMTATGNRNSLIINLNYDLFKAHVPYCWEYHFNSDMLKKYLYDDYGLRSIFMGAYALEGWAITDNINISYHPNTLDSGGYDKTHGILSYATTPSQYDTWLQNHLDDPVNISGRNYSYISKLMYDLSKNTDMRIFNCAQAHLWYSSGHKLKEPSNEELELQASLPITYNAKGLIWFSYNSGNSTFDSSQYDRGIMEYSGLPRTDNAYHQNKYQRICEINGKLKKWSPYILSFNPDLTKHCTYRLESERPAFINSTFFFKYCNL